MARPLRIQYPGAFYYITQYGNERKAFFKSADDYANFLEILKTSMATHSTALHGFVLLKNHFHLLIETPLGNLSEFMRHLNITYTAYFNRIYQRRGHIYAGRYKSIVLEKDLYLLPLSQYLHLNPIMVGMQKRCSRSRRNAFLPTWKWSSLPGFMGTYPRYHFINHQLVLDSFGGDTPQGRRKYTEALLQLPGHGLSLKAKIIDQSILGSSAFVREMKKRSGTTLPHKQPGVKKIGRFLEQEKILTELERGLHCERDQLLKIPGDRRSIAMDMLYRYGGLTNPAIAVLMNLDYTSISLTRKKIRQKRLHYPALNAGMTLLETRLERLRSL